MPIFKQYLATEYPEYEKDIYEKISPNNTIVYFAKYPELKNIEGVKLLVEKINTIRDTIYEKELEKLKLEKNINMRRKNKLYIKWLVPKYVREIDEN